MALSLAQKAGDIQIALQSNLKNIEIKEDQSPVTEVDKQCDALIKKGLLEAFPEDGFFGEESESIIGSTGRTWIVDPLDGTRPYIRGIPTYSVLISLEENNIPILGVVHIPALKETYYAAKGSGAFCNGKKIAVSSVNTPAQATGTSLGLIECWDNPLGTQLLQSQRSWDYSYGFMDAYSYMCVASGKLDLCISLIDKPWDRSAAACIISEAGGSYSDLQNNSTVYNETFLISNGHVHQAIIDQFNL